MDPVSDLDMVIDTIVYDYLGQSRGEQPCDVSHELWFGTDPVNTPSLPCPGCGASL